MRQLIWGKSFVRALKRAVKKQPAIRDDIKHILSLLERDPFAPSLETHKLIARIRNTRRSLLA